MQRRQPPNCADRAKEPTEGAGSATERPPSPRTAVVAITATVREEHARAGTSAPASVLRGARSRGSPA
eukprot:10937192-Lingulodinium_polyedra.AAC.1